MKYYPLSQVKTGLLSQEGQFMVITGSPSLEVYKKIQNNTYVGPYFKTSDGKFFTGKTPSDPNGVFELKQLSYIKDNTGTQQVYTGDSLEKQKSKIEDIIDSNKPSSYYTHEYGYRRLTKKPYYSNAPSPPPTIKFTLSEDDKHRGWARRYFAKHRLNNNIIEISKQTFDILKSKSTNMQYELYKIIEIKWNIYEDSDLNLKQIQLANKMGFTGLDQFL